MDRLPVEGETFGRYRLLQQLGEGGMGVVYVAQDEVLNRKVALKLVLPRHAADPEFRSRFAREAEAQARLESSHVVRIYDYGDQDGVLFLCTQYVDGGDLAMRVADSGALAPALAVEVVTQVLEGLEEAHHAGVVHRDVKPANVLLRPRGEHLQAYLCDFGIATMAGQGLTQVGQVVGSLPWMAPERHYGTEPGPVGDVYSAGCVLWFALTGTAPYVGSDGEVMRGHIEGLVPQLPGRTPFIKRLNAVLAGALAKHPEDRYASAGAMAADLRGLAAVAPAALALDDATIIRPAGARPATGPRAAATGSAARAGVTILRGAKTKPTTGPRAVGASMASARHRWILPVIAVVGVLAIVSGGLGLRAVLSDDLALADGTTEASNRPFVIAPQPTLHPQRKARGAAVAPPEGAPLPPISGTGTGLETGIVTGIVTGIETGIDMGTGTGAGPRSSEAPAAVTQAQPTAAAPTYRYRCWDSATHLTNDLASCGNPTGDLGARWMQSRVDSACWAGNANDARILETYGCSFSGGVLYVARATGGSDGAAWLRLRMPDGRTTNDWYTGTSRAGTAYQGRATINGVVHYRWGRVWAMAGTAWLVYVDATSSAGQSTAMKQLDGKYRHINWVRGLPCDQGC